MIRRTVAWLKLDIVFPSVAMGLFIGAIAGGPDELSWAGLLLIAFGMLT